MAIYSKSDMCYNYYTWTTYSNDNPKVTGVPDNTLLNRKEGYEVLYFINKFAELYALDPKVCGKKIEMMIRNSVPSNIHSQKEISTWILNHWI